MDLDWLETAEGREWLGTAEGRGWLESDEAIEWYNTMPTGRAWLESSEGRAWMDELVVRGFADYFAGRMAPPPESFMAPEEAPRVGERVRLAEDRTTISGTTLREGELAIVVEARLAPAGFVWVKLLTIDGRTLLTADAEDFQPA